MIDSCKRKINYLRISVTDRCNLRCKFCMPEEGLPNIAHSQILRYEEILKITSAASAIGINRFRISGGEPLLRKGITDFISQLKSQEHTKQVSLTTNAMVLEKHVDKLAQAKLTSLNISLDTLKSQRMKEITGSDQIEKVLSGINLAVNAKIPVKINTLLFEEVLDELDGLIALSEEKGIPIRFIEYMPLDYNASKRITETPISTDRLIEKLSTFGRLSKTKGPLGSGPSEYYHIEGRSATIGIIGALTTPFCSTCNRLRLTSDGFIKPCLASADELDTKIILRGDLNEKSRKKALIELFEKAASKKPVSHSMQDGQTPSREMSRIGG